MNTGYRIEIQSNLDEKEMFEAKKMANKFNPIYKCRLKSSAFFRRGILGLVCSEKEFKHLYIRRAVKNRRIFHIVRQDALELKECEENRKILYCDCEDAFGPCKCNLHIGEPLPELKDICMCMCAIHKGGLKVRLKEPIETFVYKEEGIIKG